MSDGYIQVLQCFIQEFIIFLFSGEKPCLCCLSMQIVVSEIAKRIVEALTCSHVLGKVLTPEEASILRDYFSRKIRLSEQVFHKLLKGRVIEKV